MTPDGRVQTGGVVPLAELVRRSIDRWDAALEVALFGTGDAEAIAAEIERFCSAQLADPAGGLFYRPGVGAVAGLQLRDGREVVVKVHRWNVSVERLSAVRAVQRHLFDRGLAAPRPLGGPTPLGAGIATVEAYLAGESANGRAPAIRRVIASGLCDLVINAHELTGSVDVGAPVFLRPPGAPLWPEPHDLRFDFEATARGAEWIDELATLARDRLLDGDGLPVIGHFDWRVENLAFHGPRIAAIYDWDSLATAPECVLVGHAAAQFCTDWASDDPDPLPTLKDMVAFVGGYEQARGTPFRSAEREMLDAANLAHIAYGARCQHSDLSRHPEIASTSTNRWLRLLRERATRSLVRT